MTTKTKKICYNTSKEVYLQRFLHAIFCYKKAIFYKFCFPLFKKHTKRGKIAYKK